MNASNTFSLDKNLKIQISIFLVLDSIVTLCTIVGNGMFMAILLLKRSLHTPPNILLGALCLSDLFVGAIVQPLHIVELSYKLAGQSGEQVLEAKTTLTWFCVGLSFQHILLISLDRYAALGHPFWYHTHATSKRHIKICIITSILPISVTTISIVLLLKHHIIIRDYFLSIVVFIALLAVAVTNWKTFYILHQQKPMVVIVGEIEGENRNVINKSRQERKKTYVIAVVVILFFICYFPIFVELLLRFYHKKSSASITTVKAVKIWTDFLMLANSAVNPLVYYARMTEIRRAASDLLCRRSDIAVGRESSRAVTS